MELSDVLHQMMQQSQQAGQPTELRVGTVVSTSPLEISINSAMPNLQAGVLYLTSAVVEKKIPVLSHTHTVGDSQTGEALQSMVCTENGQALPVENGYMILNRALQSGDKVLLLRVQKGQKFIVLSRVMEVD